MKISIVVPVYNVEKELKRCLDSLTNQTYLNIEVILVDDGSTDNSGNICDVYAKKDLRFHVIHQDNGGLSEARNVGVRMVSGDYFLLVDSDDYLELDACEKFVSIAKSTNADIIIADFIVEDGELKTVNTHRKLQEGKVYSSKEYLINAISAGEFHAEQWANLYKSKFWKKHNLQYKKGILHEDMEIVWKQFLPAETISYLKYPFYHYVIRNGSTMTSDNVAKRHNDVISIYTSWKSEISLISDFKLKRVAKGLLAKCYIYSCATLKIGRLDREVLKRRELILYSRGVKEKFRALFFSITPKYYVKIYESVICRK